MIRLETDASDVVLGQIVREYARQHHDAGAATRADPLPAGAVVTLSDSWQQNALEGLRVALVAAGYRVYIEIRTGPL